MTKHSLTQLNDVADFFYHKQRHYRPSQRAQAAAVLRQYGLSPALIEQVLAGKRLSARQLGGSR